MHHVTIWLEAQNVCRLSNWSQYRYYVYSSLLFSSNILDAMYNQINSPLRPHFTFYIFYVFNLFLLGVAAGNLARFATCLNHVSIWREREVTWVPGSQLSVPGTKFCVVPSAAINMANIKFSATSWQERLQFLSRPLWIPRERSYYRANISLDIC